jgi:hypothetical protein
MTDKMKHYYHYTKGSHLLRILDDGIIKTAIMGFNKGEKNAVNLTKSQKLEATAYLGAPIENQGGAFRFIISNECPTIITWAKYKYVGNMKTMLYDGLNMTARMHGSDISQWYVSLTPIPKKYWLGFELLGENGWFIPYEEHQWIEYVSNNKIPEHLEEIWGDWRNAKPLRTDEEMDKEFSKFYKFLK